MYVQGIGNGGTKSRGKEQVYNKVNHQILSVTKLNAPNFSKKKSIERSNISK